MANYRQANISGTRHVRATRVVCDNDLSAQRGITFHEESVANIDAEQMRVSMGALYEPFIPDGPGANLAESFDLLHPETGAVVGAATYTDVYVMLHSLYYHVATKRDA